MPALILRSVQIDLKVFLHFLFTLSFPEIIQGTQGFDIRYCYKMVYLGLCISSFASKIYLSP